MTTIEISEGGRHKIVEFPKHFEDKGFVRCWTKAQFDYLSDSDPTTRYVYLDYKKRLIYFHEGENVDPIGDCDYAWPSSIDSRKKVFAMWSD